MVEFAGILLGFSCVCLGIYAYSLKQRVMKLEACFDHIEANVRSILEMEDLYV